MNPDRPDIPLRVAIRVWLKIGLINFGGPAGQIALMHRLLVEERRWVSEARFLHALNYCMLLPGPEAQQLATYIGWLMHRTVGGLVAGTLFILPGFVLMLLIGAAYVSWGELQWMQGLLLGMQAATLAIVVQAVVRLGARTLRHGALYALAAVAFTAIFAFDVPFPLIVLGAAALGILGTRLVPRAFAPPGEEGVLATADPLPETAVPPPTWTLRVLLSGVLLWGLPVLLLLASLGASHVYTQQALFFSKMAVVTFGGAYAVLAYMTQQAVERYGWLSPTEMVQGLALAETTPGPLILVLTYVGFLAAYREPGALDPLLAGVLGGSLSTWITFVPCFLWIFLGAPYVERLRGHRALSAALTGITAAVVGVILNLSVWFALHVWFAQIAERPVYGVNLPLPLWSTADPVAITLSAMAMLALLPLRAGLMWVLAGSAGLGLVASLLGWTA